MTNIALYIHIPWCKKKCHYCDFNSHVTNNIPQREYIRALIKDLSYHKSLLKQVTITTIFIGGGTPSIIDGQLIAYLIDYIKQEYSVVDNVEITIEINPNYLDLNNLKFYKKCDINRISIGVQSFNNDYLMQLGRFHNKIEALQSINQVLQIFHNVNIDMMYALPQQTLATLKSDLGQLLAFKEIKHISYYNLTIEPKTHFYKLPPKGLPDNDIAYIMQKAIDKELKDEKFIKYEISAYAKNEYQCKHNLNYWKYGDYIGIGAGAHSKITINGMITRKAKVSNPKKYMQMVVNNTHIITDNIVSQDELPFEFAMNAFRLLERIPISLFEESTNSKSQILLNKLKIATKQGLLDITDTYIKTTDKGQCFLNNILLSIIN